jgi:hypothetical protein
MPSHLLDHLSIPIPEKLWHYTSIDAFLKIVENKTIRATDMLFMNDREEFMHAREVVNRMVEETPELDARYGLRSQSGNRLRSQQ